MKQEIISPSTTTEALNRLIETPALDPILLGIANEYLQGKTIDDIAEEYQIPRDRVTTVLDKREVKAYVDGVYATQGYLNRTRRLALINKVIEEKVTEALETGQHSKKDLLDWMKHLDEIESKVKPQEKGPAVAVQINNYDKLMQKLVD